MSVTVCGCGLSFKASGLRNHQRQSFDIRCQTEFDDCGDCNMSENADIERQGFITGVNENTTGAEFEVDPAGDFFGDYNDFFFCRVYGPRGLDPIIDVTFE
jgi:hypothetical protein